MELHNIIGILLVVIVLCYFVYDVYGMRHAFGYLINNDKLMLSEYTKTQLKPIVDMFLNDLCLKYGVPVPKYQYSNLTKNDDVHAVGEYLHQTKMILIDYDEIVKLGGDVGFLTGILCHEFIHYIDHLDLESQGKDFNEVYGNRQDFYETRATDIGGKDNKKLLKKYMKNGSL